MLKMNYPKKNKNKICFFVALSVLLVAIAVCFGIFYFSGTVISVPGLANSTEPTTKFTKANQTVVFSLAKKNVKVNVGEYIQLEIDNPNNKTDKYIDFSSSDTDIATVDSIGRVDGIKKGTVTITATAGYYSSSCTVKVVGGNSKLKFTTSYTANNDILKKNKADSSGMNLYYVKVNRQENCVTVYTYDENYEYTVPVRAMVCSCGENNGTPTGEYVASDRYRWQHLFGNVDGQYATVITGDILFHSVPYESQNPDDLEIEEYNDLGKSVSMGCVRLAVADAKWIYENCVLGTTVVIYDDSDVGPLGKPNSMHITSDEKWDPTDDDKNCPYLTRTPQIKGAKTMTISTEKTEKSVNYLKGISATDTCGNDITNKVECSGKVVYGKPGTYTITYTVEDYMRRTATVNRKIIISD